MFLLSAPDQTGNVWEMPGKQDYKSHQLQHKEENRYHAEAFQTQGLKENQQYWHDGLYRNYQRIRLRLRYLIIFHKDVHRENLHHQ